MSAGHRDPAGAVQAHPDLGGPDSIARHYGTFQLTNEAIDEPIRALEAARSALGVPAARFRTLEVGESVRLG